MVRWLYLNIDHMIVPLSILISAATASYGCTAHAQTQAGSPSPDFSRNVLLGLIAYSWYAPSSNFNLGIPARFALPEGADQRYSEM